MKPPAYDPPPAITKRRPDGSRLEGWRHSRTEFGFDLVHPDGRREGPIAELILEDDVMGLARMFANAWQATRPGARSCPQCGTAITSLGRGRMPFCSSGCRIAYRDGKPITAVRR